MKSMFLKNTLIPYDFQLLRGQRPETHTDWVDRLCSSRWESNTLTYLCSGIETLKWACWWYSGCSSVQFTSRWYYMRSEKSICAPPLLSEVSRKVAFETVPLFVWHDGPLSSFQGRSSSVSSFHASLLQAIKRVMSLTRRLRSSPAG